MNDYKELIETLSDFDFADCSEHCFLPCAGTGDCYILKAADAIEQLVKERDELKEVNILLTANSEHFKRERDAAVADIEAMFRAETSEDVCKLCAEYPKHNCFYYSM